MISRTPQLALLAFAFLWTSLSSPTSANADKLTGEDIVDKMIEADPMGYGGGTAELHMLLVNKRGHRRTRTMSLLARSDGDDRRTLIRFLSPADIAGTSFLGLKEGKSRTQHLYLPAISKSRRISTAQRNTRFVGSDYSYADLDNRDLDESKKRRLADEKVAGRDCYVVEATPNSDESAYGRVVVWVSKRSWLPLRSRFYDRKDRETKRLLVKEVKKEKGRWIIVESKMVDLRSEHTTILKLKSISFDKDVPKGRFTVRELERG